MGPIYTFTAKDKSAAGASTEKDGSNLPGGAEAWEMAQKLDPADMAAGSGVVGLGNAAEVLAEVQRVGFFHAPIAGA